MCGYTAVLFFYDNVKIRVSDRVRIFPKITLVIDSGDTWSTISFSNHRKNVWIQTADSQLISWSNGPGRVLMFDGYFTICTEQECNKVCGPPGQRLQDTFEPSLGSDIQRTVVLGLDLCPCLESHQICWSPPLAVSSLWQLSWKSEKTQGLKRSVNTRFLWS